MNKFINIKKTIKRMKQIRNFFVMGLALATIASCAPKQKKNQSKEQTKTAAEVKKVQNWTINGTIEGLADSTMVGIADTYMPKDYSKLNMVASKDGKFTIKGKTEGEPTMMYLVIKDSYNHRQIYLEDGVITATGKANKSSFGGRESINYQIEVSGTPNNDAMTEFSKMRTEINNKHRGAPENAKEKQEVVDKKIADETLAATKEFLKKHSNLQFAGYAILMTAHGMPDKGVAELIALVNPNLSDPDFNELKERITNSKDVDFTEVVTASNVSYKVDASYSGAAYRKATYLGMMTNGNLVALNNDKTVAIIDGKGNQVKSFVASQTSVPSTMSIDEKNNIYVLVPEEKEVEQTFRGKTMKRKEITGYSCDVFDANGNKLRTMKLDGVKHATGARASEGKLMIADMGGRNIGIYNAETGAKEAAVEGMRPCCGILDFDINDKNEILVANLGAFRVQKYDISGKQLLAFGSRGTNLNEFHGCCNPVSVAYLSNGAIVTVEKDPTRVKVYSKEGAKTIAGIEEMVKGCSYIPMTVDSKNNLYLASPTKGVVRCVAI